MVPAGFQDDVRKSKLLALQSIGAERPSGFPHIQLSLRSISWSNIGSVMNRCMNGNTYFASGNGDNG